MAEENLDKTEGTQSDAPSDPWEQAFAAIGAETEEGSPGAADAGAGEEAEPSPSAEEPGGQSAAEPQVADSAEAEGFAGGPGDIGGADVGEDDGGSELDSLFHFEQDEIEQYRKDLTERIEQQTIRDVAAAYIKRGARNTNGRLGATIDDKDICRRDEDGVPRFFNPETGREFNGDNPRRQAQEWVDDYNRDLAEKFNRTCSEYSRKLLKEQGAGLAVIEFAPTYEKLDPVRRSMFESIIEDYEIRDEDGDIMGYSCDLNAALATVNRQVKQIQRYASQHGSKAPTGPALDMKNSGRQGDPDKMPEFKSVAEAMEWQQDQILKKQRKGR